MSRMKDPELRRIWRKRIIDHDGESADSGGIERWYKLTDGLGLDREYVKSTDGILSTTRFAVDVYHEEEAPENKVLDQSGDQLVPAGEEEEFEKVIPPILGTLKIVVTAYAEHNGILFGPDLVAHNDSGTECDPPF